MTPHCPLAIKNSFIAYNSDIRLNKASYLGLLLIIYSHVLTTTHSSGLWLTALLLNVKINDSSLSSFRLLFQSILLSYAHESYSSDSDSVYTEQSTHLFNTRIAFKCLSHNNYYTPSPNHLLVIHIHVLESFDSESFAINYNPSISLTSTKLILHL